MAISKVKFGRGGQKKRQRRAQKAHRAEMRWRPFVLFLPRGLYDFAKSDVSFKDCRFIDEDYTP